MEILGVDVTQSQEGPVWISYEGVDAVIIHFLTGAMDEIQVRFPRESAADLRNLLDIWLSS